MRFSRGNDTQLKSGELSFTLIMSHKGKFFQTCSEDSGRRGPSASFCFLCFSPKTHHFSSHSFCFSALTLLFLSHTLSWCFFVCLLLTGASQSYGFYHNPFSTAPHLPHSNLSLKKKGAVWSTGCCTVHWPALFQVTTVETRSGGSGTTWQCLGLLSHLQIDTLYIYYKHFISYSAVNLDIVVLFCTLCVSLSWERDSSLCN